MKRLVRRDARAPHAGETPALPEMPADPFVSATRTPFRRHPHLPTRRPSLLETEPLQTTHLPFAHLLDDLQISGASAQHLHRGVHTAGAGAD
jgi:hypothetical protein